MRGPELDRSPCMSEPARCNNPSPYPLPAWGEGEITIRLALGYGYFNGIGPQTAPSVVAQFQRLAYETARALSAFRFGRGARIR